MYVANNHHKRTFNAGIKYNGASHKKLKEKCLIKKLKVISMAEARKVGSALRSREGKIPVETKPNGYDGIVILARIQYVASTSKIEIN